MTTYRVGSAGASVFDSDGRVLYRLSPGTVVVEGTIETAGSSAEQYAKNVRARSESKRVRGYADKKLRPTEDKSS